MNVELLAKEHYSGEPIISIAKRHRISTGRLIKELKRFSNGSDWYDYRIICRRNKSKGHEKTTVDQTSARVYQNFINTMRGLGLSDLEIWQKIHEIWQRNDAGDVYEKG